MTSRRERLQVFSVCLILSWFVPVACFGDADRIYRENSGAVVVVMSLDDKGQPLNLGSGFVVRDDGAVVTNYHVINMASEVKVKVGKEVLPVEGILHADMENDVAILKLKGKGFASVRLGDSGRVRVGERVYAIGSPQGLENTLSEGILSGIRKAEGNRSILQITAAISPGSSGGPVFNSRGEVVGIATFLIADTQNLNFALPVNLIKPYLRNRDVVNLQQVCTIDFDKSADCWLLQGIAHGTRGDLPKAVEAFEQAAKADPKRVAAFVNLAVAYAGMNRMGDAEETLNRAMAIDPKRPEVLVNLAVLYGRTGRQEEALSILKEAIAANPDHAESHLTLAVAYRETGRTERAVEAATRAAELDPEYVDAHGFLGQLYLQMLRYQEAAAAFKAVIRLRPDDPRGHEGLGDVYLASGNRAAALEEYKILKGLNAQAAQRLFDKIYR